MAAQLRPIIRDIVFLTVGAGVFIWEAVNDARPVPMTLAMVMALGPSAIAAYWSARTQGSGSSALPGSSSPPPLPSPSSPGGGEA